MNILLDLSVIAVLIVCVWLSARRGFVRTLIEAIGFILALAISFSISGYVAEFIYDKTIEPAIVSSVEDAATTATEETVTKIWDKIPSIFTEDRMLFGFTKEKISESVSENIGDAATVAAENASQSVIRPTAIKTLTAIVSTFMFITLLIVVKLLARVINKLFSFSLAGKINRTLGGIIGIPKALISAIAFCMAVTFIVTVFGGSFKYITKDAIGNAKIFSFFLSFSPFK